MNIELSVNQINEKLNSGLYKINEKKGISQKYQERSGSSYESYSYWWGSQYYMKNQTQVDDLNDDISTMQYLLLLGTPASALLGPFATAAVAGFGGQFEYMKNRVSRTFRLNGSCKLTLYFGGVYFTTEGIQ